MHQYEHKGAMIFFLNLISFENKNPKIKDLGLILNALNILNVFFNSGKVERCKRGFFKSKADWSICEPHTQ